MSENDHPREWRIGDTANGYVLTPDGWQPQGAVQPPQAAPTQEFGVTPQYRLGDVANGYVLTPQGWQPVGVPTTAPPSGGSRRTLWIAVAAVAVVVVAAVGIGVALWPQLSSNPVAVPSTTRTSATPTPSRTSRTASPTTTASSGTTSSASTGKAFTYGEAADVTEGGKPYADLTVDAPVPFTSDSSLFTPDRGQYVYVPVTLKAVGQTAVTATGFDFEAILADGTHVDAELLVQPPDTAPKPLNVASLKSGETVTGALVFDVPPNQPISVAYSPSGRVLGTWST